MITTIFLDTRLSKSKHRQKCFKNFCQSYSRLYLSGNTWWKIMFWLAIKCCMFAYQIWKFVATWTSSHVLRVKSAQVKNIVKSCGLGKKLFIASKLPWPFLKLEFYRQAYDVWLTKILETFPRVFWFRKSHIKETVVTINWNLSWYILDWRLAYWLISLGNWLKSYSFVACTNVQS